MAVYLLPDKVVSIALSQVGYKEGANNWNKYAKDLDAINFYNGKKQNVAWCDVFVDWCVWQAAGEDKDRALKALYEPKKDNCGAGCKYSAQYFRKNNAWSNTAQIGAQIFFGKKGAETHTGIVVGIGVSTITTVEGNKGNEVKKCSYSKNYDKIAGYGLIKYDTETQAQPQPTPQPEPQPQPDPTPAPATPSEPTYIKYKIKSGDTLSKIAKKYGTTVKAIKEANPDKIKNVNKIYAGDTIKIPQ